jgi:hypothetical protein
MEIYSLCIHAFGQLLGVRLMSGSRNLRPPHSLHRVLLVRTPTHPSVYRTSQCEAYPPLAIRRPFTAHHVRIRGSMRRRGRDRALDGTLGPTP